MQLTEEKKTQVVLRIFSEDIEAFGKYLFGHHLRLATPPFHKEIFQLFQGNDKRIGIAAPRSHAKSTITDLVYLLWAVIHKKTHFVLLVSDTYSQATLFLEAVQAEIEGNEKLRALYGNLKGEIWSEGEMVIGGAMVKAVGAGMKVRGLKYHEYRPDLILVDDLENDELVESKARREKLERWFNGALVPSMDKNGRLVIIGTVLHYDSLLYKILSNDLYNEYTKKTYKAMNDTEALWPEHMSIPDLLKLKEEYTRKGQGYLFYQEFQNDPISGENRKFRLEKIKYYTDAEIEKKQLRTYITIDRAYSTQKTSDFTAFVVVSVDNENNWYVRMADRFRGTEDLLIENIFDLRAYFKPIKIGIEQRAFEYTLKPTLEKEMRVRNDFFVITELKDAQLSKTYRIEGLVPRFETGTIYLKKDQSDLIDELIRFPAGSYDDLVDALAYQLQIQLPANAPKRQAFTQETSYSLRMA